MFKRGVLILSTELTVEIDYAQVSSGGIRLLRSGVRFRDMNDFNDEHTDSWDPGFARYRKFDL